MAINDDTAKQTDCEDQHDSFVAELIASISSDKVVAAIAPDSFKKVNDEMYVAGQIDSSFVKDIKELGIKTLFNLREETEEGYQGFPEDLPEGVTTVHYPVPDNMAWSEASADKLLGQLDSCAKPFLVYCKTGARAAAVGVAHTSTRSRFRAGQISYDGAQMSEAQQSLLASVCEGRPEDECQMKRFVQEYVGKKVALASARPGINKVKEDLWVSGQLSEREYEEMKEQGIVAVLCTRPMEEAGEFGLGVLGREEEIVKGLGMEWVYCPVPRCGPYSAELTAKMLGYVDSMPRPLLIHCRTGRRVMDIMGLNATS